MVGELDEHTTEAEKVGPQSLLAKAIASFTDFDKVELIRFLAQINGRLTEGGGSHFQYPDKLETVIDKLFTEIQEEDMGEAQIYLGDGGHSRLNVGKDSRGEYFVELSGSSTDEVKEKWKDIEEEYQSLDKQKQ